MSQLSFRQGYTRIPHLLIERVFTRYTFPAYEMRVLWAVMRLTWGWSAKGDYISYRQLADLTCLNLRNVQRSVKSLENKLVLYTRPGRRRTWMEISFDFMSWRLPDKDTLFTSSAPDNEQVSKELMEEFKNQMGWKSS